MKTLLLALALTVGVCSAQNTQAYEIGAAYLTRTTHVGYGVYSCIYIRHLNDGRKLTFEMRYEGGCPKSGIINTQNGEFKPILNSWGR